MDAEIKALEQTKSQLQSLLAIKPLSARLQIWTNYWPTEVKRIESLLESLRSQIDALNRQNSDLQQSIGDFTTRQKTLSVQITSLTQQLQTINGFLDEIQTSLAK